MVKFVHTADWQLGKTFRQFGKGLAETLRQARLDAIESLAKIALQNDAPHIIVAGDIFDHEMANPKTIKQAFDIMVASSGVKWWLLPGNHDPHRQNHGLWSRILDTDLPDNIVPMLIAEPLEMEPGAYILPAPWFSKNPGVDNTTWMNQAELAEGAIRIGTAHGSAISFAQAGNSGQNCIIKAFDRIKTAKLDYLALGDWHGKVELNDRIWYSGTPETDSFKDNAPGWALIVEIKASGIVPIVKPVRTTSFHWINKEIQLYPNSEIDDLFESLLDTETQRRKTLMRLSLTGRISASQTQDIKQYLENAGLSLAYFQCNFEALDTVYTDGDLDNLNFSGSLRNTAQDLITRKNNPEFSNQDRKDAERALELLISFSSGDSA